MVPLELSFVDTDFDKVQENEQNVHIDEEELPSKVCKFVSPILNDQFDEVIDLVSSDCQSDEELDVDMEVPNNTNLDEDKEPIHHSDYLININKGI